MTRLASPRKMRAAGVALAILVERAGQQNHFVALLRPLQQLARGQEVLGSQDLRGRHQGGLVAVLDGHQHGLQGDDGLARAHIALQQPAHRFRRAHVGDDLAQSALLRLGGVEGQHLAQRRADLGIGLEGECPAARGICVRFSSRPSSR